jgi:hypothetical protein
MLPLDVPRSNPPSWIDELRSTVLWPNRPWAPTESVSILLAVRELQGWLVDRRPYEKLHKQGWLSVLGDFQQSVGQLGPALLGALGDALTAAVGTGNDLKADFESTKQPVVMASLLRGRQPAAQTVFDRLRDRFTAGDVREAAWSDLVKACHDPNISSSTLAFRRDLFWQLLRVADHDVTQMSQLLAGILANAEYYILSARTWLGDLSSKGIVWPRPDKEAHLPEDQLLTLCRRLMTKSSIPGHYVIWVAFDRAGPGTIHQEVGSVSFWNCAWAREVLLGGDGPNLAAVPGELKTTDGFFRPDALPVERDVMLARVVLGKGAWTDPVRVATEQAEAVVALAGFRVGDAKWRPLPGYFIVLNGRLGSRASFDRELDLDDMVNGLYQDRMSSQLAELAPKLQAHLPVTDGDFSEIVQAVRWWQQARKQPPLAAILLQVRVLELLSQRVGISKWYAYLDQYQQASWIRHVMISELAGAVDDCLRNYELVVDPEEHAWLREFSLAITSFQAGGAYTRDLRRGLGALPQLVRLFPPHDARGRRIHSVANRFTLPRLLEWHRELEKEWRLTLDRLVRVRNALAHGGPIQDDSAITVHGFAQQLAAWSLSVALEGLLEGAGVLAAHESRRQQSERWTRALSSAPAAIDALLGPQ